MKDSLLARLANWHELTRHAGQHEVSDLLGEARDRIVMLTKVIRHTSPGFGLFLEALLGAEVSPTLKIANPVEYDLVVTEIARVGDKRTITSEEARKLRILIEATRTYGQVTMIEEVRGRLAREHPIYPGFFAPYLSSHDRDALAVMYDVSDNSDNSADNTDNTDNTDDHDTV